MLPQHSIRTEVDISAKPEQVWSVFTDFRRQKEWNGFLCVDAASGPLKQGERLKVDINTGGKPATFTPEVLDYEHNSLLRWRGKLLGNDLLFVGEHYFEARPKPGGGTQWVHGEQFSGLLLPLVGGMLKATEKGFHDFNAGLKKEAETTKGRR